MKTLKKGFTLLELMMVVVVVGILVAFAVPNYEKAVELQRWRTARDLLMTIHYGQRAYFFASPSPGTYCDVTGGSASCCASATCWNSIHMDDPNLASVRITFTSTAIGGPPSTFTATATNTAGGRCNGKWMLGDETQPLTIQNTGGWGTDTQCACC